jgi:hypothetical protein
VRLKGEKNSLPPSFEFSSYKCDQEKKELLTTSLREAKTTRDIGILHPNQVGIGKAHPHVHDLHVALDSAYFDPIYSELHISPTFPQTH